MARVAVDELVRHFESRLTNSSAGSAGNGLYVRKRRLFRRYVQQIDELLFRYETEKRWIGCVVRSTVAL